MHPFELLRLVARGWWIIAISSVVGVVAAGVVSATISTKYTATTQIYFAASGGADGQDLAYAATYAQTRVANFKSLATTASVLEPAAVEVGGSMTADTLGPNVSVTTSLTTTVMGVSVTDASAERAAEAANAVSAALIGQVGLLEKPRKDEPSAIEGTIVSPAQVPSSPSVPNWPLNLIVGLIAGLVVGVGTVVVRETVAKLRASGPIEA